MSPHALGIVGELLNLVGGLILAGDVLFRERSRKRKVGISGVNRFAKEYGLSSKYKGVPAASEDLADQIIDQQVTIYGWIGVLFLLLGFALLAGYHILEIK